VSPRLLIVPYHSMIFVAVSLQVYLERCEAHRILPLSSCIQSVIHTREMPHISGARYLGDPGAKDGEGGKEEADSDAGVTQGGAARREESIVISLRDYSMSAAGVSAVITWLRSRAQQALLPAEGSTFAVKPLLSTEKGRGAANPHETGGSGGGGGGDDTSRQRMRLDLSGNGLRAGDSKALLAELGVVLHLPNAAAGITELDLSRNGIGEHAHLLFPGPLTGTTSHAGISSLPAVKLASSHTLTTLKLSEIGLGESAAPALARALAGNQTLTALSLSKNQLGSHCAQALAEQLQVPQKSPAIAESPGKEPYWRAKSALDSERA